MPKPGIGGCTFTHTSLDDLITDFTSNGIPEPAANGVIWIEGNTDSSGSPVIIDGSDTTDLGSWKNFTLTLKGGWTGTTDGDDRYLPILPYSMFH